MVAGKKYRSAIDCGASVGAAVAAGAGSTANDVTACDGQYDSDPPNEAYTVYLPSMFGIQLRLKNPSASAVVVPIDR